MTTTYRVLFQDVLTGYIHGELPAESIDYTTTRNTPGSATITLDLVPGVSRVTRTSLVAGAATAIHIERNGQFVWSGLYWDAEADYAAGTMKLRCEGWLSYFRLRGVHTTKQYTRWDQADIARDLVRHAGTYGPGSRLGMVKYGNEKTGVIRDRMYKETDRKSIGEAVEQLAAVTNGFDFAFEADWSGSFEDELAVWFRIRYPVTGRKRDLVLEDGVNCAILGARLSGTSVRTWAIATGAGDGPEQVWATSSRPSTVYPRLESVVSTPDVKEVATLQAKADFLTRVRATPILLPTIDIYPDIALGVSALGVGDIVAVAGGYGLMPISGEWMVTDLAVAVDANGAENITATVAPLEVFEDA
ncbi:MAG: hypothetical protein ABIQ18_39800 [Umezawaea sp.]